MSTPSGQDGSPPGARQTAMAGARQAMGRGGRRLHTLVQLVLGLALLIGIGVAGVAIRLAQGPWEVAWLARRITQNTATGITVGRVALTWEGLHGGIDRPLDLVLTDVAVDDTKGRRVAFVPKAEVSLGVLALLRGKLALRAVQITAATLTLRRETDGRLTLDGDPSSKFAITPAMLAPLRHVGLLDGTFRLDDRKLGVVWTASQLNVDVARNAADAAGTASAMLGVGDQTAHADAELTLPDAGGITAHVTLSPVNPAHLAAVSPNFAQLSALDAALSLSGTVAFDSAYAFATASLNAAAGPGSVHVGTGVMPIRSARINATAAPNSLAMTLTQLRLQARDAEAPTTVTGYVTARLADGKIDAQASATVDQVAFADLPALWPQGIGGPGTRDWITQNITGGSARGGHVALSLTAAQDFSNATLTKISGGIDGVDVTTHWLRPVPPVEHGTAHLMFVDPDTIDIQIDAGTQSGTALKVTGGTVRLTGIAGHDQALSLQAKVAGPLADTVALLRLKALHLLDRRPIQLREPTGEVNAALSLKMPLKSDLKLDSVAIHATGKLSGGHLGAIAAGHDIDQADLGFDVTNTGLKITGTGAVSGIPAQLQVDMDFRDGPPAEVLEHVVARADATGQQVATAGFDTGGRLSGTLALQLDYASRRDGTADLQAAADLTRAGVSLAPLTWRKAEGVAGRIEAHMKLRSERIIAIDRVTATAPGLSVLASADAAGGRASLLHIQHVTIGDGTELSGELRLPAQPGQPYAATLSGPRLDLSWMFAHAKPGPKPAAAALRGPAYTVKARIAHVLMAGAGSFQNVVADVANDGLITTRAQLSAAIRGSRLSLLITPAAGGRSLRIQSDDAGSVLRAFDVTDTMQGGKLQVTALYNDHDQSPVLRGAASIDDFRIVKAPAMARLLQAMSLYGLVDLVQGPGLGFARLVAPFGLSNDSLTLRNARAYNSSLGITAEGSINLSARSLQMQGTVIPAYLFNSLLGRIPFLGRLFSPERGGGVFAASYGVRGTLDNPQVSINPLAALTPGFLRGFFDIFQSTPKKS